MRKRLLVFSVIGSVFFMACVTSPPPPALTKAVRAGNEKKVQELLLAGEDLNQRYRGNTPLEEAAETGNVKMVVFLLPLGAKDPGRAFDIAMYKKQYNVARHIVESGYIDVNKHVKSFYSLLQDGDVPFEERMGKVKDIGGDIFNTPYLLSFVEPEYYEQIINYFNIDVYDKADEIGNSLLAVAASRNNLDLVEYLLENDFNVNLLDNKNHTALFYAITCYGPNVDWNNPIIENETTARIKYVSDMPFYYDPQSIQRKQLAIVQALLEAGIDVNQQNSYGWTVLHFAAAAYPPGLQELLVLHGADESIKTNLDRTPADILALRK